MTDDSTPLPPDAIRYGCRVCRAETSGSATVCDSCRPKVLAFTGGSEDRHVRQYIGYLNRMGQGIAAEPDPIPAVQPAYVRGGRHQCMCGQFYSREIAIVACLARAHRPLNQEK